MSATSDARPAANMDATPTVDDRVGGQCNVDFPCGPWQRFTCEAGGGYRALESRGCESVCPPGPCSGGVCVPAGPTLACPAGTRCVMHQPMSADNRMTPCEPVGGDAGADGGADAGDGAPSCPLPTSAAACASDAECTTIARQCYCGAQPVEGVNTRSAAAAAACEAQSGMTCALGCAVFDGRRAQDGRTVTDAGVIAVRCEREGASGRCVTFVRP